MGKVTGISWTDSTFNPWIGCTKVGPGCDHCYAEATNKRWANGENWGPGAPRKRMSDKYRRQPFKWNKTALQNFGRKQRVFCASQADVFDNEAEQAWRDELWETINLTPNLDWQLVTKRVGNVPKMVPRAWMEFGFPKNVIVIATMVNQEEVERDMPKLREIGGRRGLSIEPQIDLVILGKWRPYLDWIITGGESQQPGAEPRPYHITWARSLISQCAGTQTTVFVKQLGARPMASTMDDVAIINAMKDRRAGADPSEWPEDLRMQVFPV